MAPSQRAAGGPRGAAAGAARSLQCWPRTRSPGHVKQCALALGPLRRRRWLHGVGLVPGRSQVFKGPGGSNVQRRQRNPGSGKGAAGRRQGPGPSGWAARAGQGRCHLRGGPARGQRTAQASSPRCHPPGSRCSGPAGPRSPPGLACCACDFLTSRSHSDKALTIEARCPGSSAEPWIRLMFICQEIFMLSGPSPNVATVMLRTPDSVHSWVPWCSV